MHINKEGKIVFLRCNMDAKPPGLSLQFKIRPDGEDLSYMGIVTGRSVG